MSLIDRITNSNQGPTEIINVISQAKLNSQEVIVKSNGEVGTRGWLGKKWISFVGKIRGEDWRNENKIINNQNVATAFAIKTKQAFARQYDDPEDKAYIEQKIESLFYKGAHYSKPHEEIRRGIYEVGHKTENRSLRLVEAHDLRNALIELSDQLPSKLRRHQEKTAQAATHLQASYGATAHAAESLEQSQATEPHTAAATAETAEIDLQAVARKYQANPKIAKYLVGGGPEFGKVLRTILSEPKTKGVQWGSPFDQKYATLLNKTYEQELVYAVANGRDISDHEILGWAVAALKQAQN